MMLADSIAQLDHKAACEQCWDTVIIGAGPAGTAAAMVLAAAGYRVLLVDKKSFPRIKACGDAITKKAQDALEQLGLLEDVLRLGHKVTGVRLLDSHGSAAGAPVECVCISRKWFDALLVRHALYKGAKMATGAVTGIAETTDGVNIQIKNTAIAIAAKTTIIATGAAGYLHSNALKMNATAASGFAIRGYIESDRCLDDLVLSFDDYANPGYNWIFPMGNGAYNIGSGVMRLGPKPQNVRRQFETFIHDHPLIRELRVNGGPVSGLVGAPLRCGLAGRFWPVAGRVLVAGDALGATFPFTGEGISAALRTGIIAAETLKEALASGDREALMAYPLRLRRELKWRYRRYRLAEALIYRMHLGDPLIRLLQRPLIHKLALHLSHETKPLSRPGKAFPLARR